eukprot:14160135-Alexandrium_andersonii.AAC.1
MDHAGLPSNGLACKLRFWRQGRNDSHMSLANTAQRQISRGLEVWGFAASRQRSQRVFTRNTWTPFER